MIYSLWRIKIDELIEKNADFKLNHHISYFEKKLPDY
jgi:hypothetical protein